MILPQSPHRGIVFRWFAALLAVSLICPTFGLAETWTSLRGTHQVDAKLVGLWGGNVILELSNGRRVSVKLNDLRSESRILAQELARELASSRGERINELKGQATAAAAPAPEPLPVPPPAPPYVAPQPNQSSTNFFAQFDEAIASGHLLAIYDSLPPSYRQDINDLVRTSAQGIDPAAWNNLVGSIQRLGDLIVTRQKWFLSSPRVQALRPEQREMAEGPLLTFAGLLRVGFDTEAMQLDKLQSMDFREWLVERDQAIAPYLAQLFQQIGFDSLREVTVESEADGVAVASVNVDGSTRKVTYVWVDGYWVPKSLADQWSASVETWKQSPESNLVASVTAASFVLQAITPALDTLAGASDAGSFHAAMESVFTPAETIVTSVAGLLGKNMNLAGRGNAQNSYDDYGDYEDYDDMTMDSYDSDLGYDDMESEYGNQSSGPSSSQPPRGRGR